MRLNQLFMAFSTMCLSGPVVGVFLVLRNCCVPGCMLSGEQAAGTRQLCQCCNNYSPSLIPIQQAALHLAVCANLTHSKLFENWADWRALQSTLFLFFPRTYSRPGIWITPLEKGLQSHSHVLLFIHNKALYLTHIAAFVPEWENTAEASSARARVREVSYFCPLLFPSPLPSVFLCLRSLTVTLGACQWQMTCANHATLEKSQALSCNSFWGRGENVESPPVVHISHSIPGLADWPFRTCCLQCFFCLFFFFLTDTNTESTLLIRPDSAQEFLLSTTLHVIT